MTDEQIISALKAGEVVSFGCHGRNTEVMALITGLVMGGLVETRDISLDQETRREARWIGPIVASPEGGQ